MAAQKEKINNKSFVDVVKNKEMIDSKNEEKVIEIDSLRRQFTIPKVRKTEKELLESVATSSVQYQREILQVLEQSYRDKTSVKRFVYSHPRLIHNSTLLEDFVEKRKIMKQDRSEKELQDIFGFLSVKTETEMRKYALEGICCGNSTMTFLGNPTMGVYLCKHSDIIQPTLLFDGQSGYILIFKIIKGKAKMMIENRVGDPLDPTPHFDCHLSKTANVDLTSVSLTEAFESTQLYIYEYTEDLEVINRPRQIYPYGVVHYNFFDSSRLKSGIVKKLHSSSEYLIRGSKHCRSDGLSPWKTSKLDQQVQNSMIPEPAFSFSMSMDVGLEESGDIVWSGNLYLQSATISDVEIVSNSKMSQSLPWYIEPWLNLDHDRISYEEMTTYYQLDLLTHLPKDEEYVSNGKFYNYYELRPMNGITTHFHRLVNLMSASGSASRIKLLKGVDLLILSNCDITFQLGLNSCSANRSLLHCIIISTMSSFTPASSQLEDLGSDQLFSISNQISFDDNKINDHQNQFHTNYVTSFQSNETNADFINESLMSTQSYVNRTTDEQIRCQQPIVIGQQHHSMPLLSFNTLSRSEETNIAGDGTTSTSLFKLHVHDPRIRRRVVTSETSLVSRNNETSKKYDSLQERIERMQAEMEVTSPTVGFFDSDPETETEYSPHFHETSSESGESSILNEDIDLNIIKFRQLPNLAPHNSSSQHTIEQVTDVDEGNMTDDLVDQIVRMKPLQAKAARETNSSEHQLSDREPEETGIAREPDSNLSLNERLLLTSTKYVKQDQLEELVNDADILNTNSVEMKILNMEALKISDVTLNSILYNVKTVSSVVQSPLPMDVITTADIKEISVDVEEEEEDKQLLKTKQLNDLHTTVTSDDRNVSDVTSRPPERRIDKRDGQPIFLNSGIAAAFANFMESKKLKMRDVTLETCSSETTPDSNDDKCTGDVAKEVMSDVMSDKCSGDVAKEVLSDVISDKCTGDVAKEIMPDVMSDKCSGDVAKEIKDVISTEKLTITIENSNREPDVEIAFVVDDDKSTKMSPVDLGLPFSLDDFDRMQIISECVTHALHRYWIDDADKYHASSAKEEETEHEMELIWRFGLHYLLYFLSDEDEDRREFVTVTDEEQNSFVTFDDCSSIPTNDVSSVAVNSELIVEQKPEKRNFNKRRSSSQIRPKSSEREMDVNDEVEVEIKRQRRQKRSRSRSRSPKDHKRREYRDYDRPTDDYINRTADYRFSDDRDRFRQRDRYRPTMFSDREKFFQVYREERNLNELLSCLTKSSFKSFLVRPLFNDVNNSSESSPQFKHTSFKRATQNEVDRILGGRENVNDNLDDEVYDKNQVPNFEEKRALARAFDSILKSEKDCLQKNRGKRNPVDNNTVVSCARLNSREGSKSNSVKTGQEDETVNSTPFSVGLSLTSSQISIPFLEDVDSLVSDNNSVIFNCTDQSSSDATCLANILPAAVTGKMDKKWPDQLATVDKDNRKLVSYKARPSSHELELISAEIVASCDPRLSINLPDTSVYAGMTILNNNRHCSFNNEQVRNRNESSDENCLLEDIDDGFEKNVKNFKIKVHVNKKNLPSTIDDDRMTTSEDRMTEKENEREHEHFLNTSGKRIEHLESLADMSLEFVNESDQRINNSVNERQESEGIGVGKVGFEMRVDMESLIADVLGQCSTNVQRDKEIAIHEFIPISTQEMFVSVKLEKHCGDDITESGEQISGAAAAAVVKEGSDSREERKQAEDEADACRRKQKLKEEVMLLEKKLAAKKALQLERENRERKLNELKAKQQSEYDERRIQMEKERIENEKQIQMENKKQVQMEKERTENEKRIQMEIEKNENEKQIQMEKERIENKKRVQMEKERIENEKRIQMEKERTEIEKRIQMEKEKIENERQIQMEKERIENEKRIQMEKERTENEKRIQMEKERLENKKQIQMEKERIENKKRVQMEKEVIENEKQKHISKARMKKDSTEKSHLTSDERLKEVISDDLHTLHSHEKEMRSSSEKNDTIYVLKSSERSKKDVSTEEEKQKKSIQSEKSEKEKSDINKIQNKGVAEEFVSSTIEERPEKQEEKFIREKVNPQFANEHVAVTCDVKSRHSKTVQLNGSETEEDKNEIVCVDSKPKICSCIRSTEKGFFFQYCNVCLQSTSTCNNNNSYNKRKFGLFTVLSNFAKLSSFEYEGIPSDVQCVFLNGLVDVMSFVEPNIVDSMILSSVHLNSLSAETQFESQFYDCPSVKYVHLNEIKKWMHEKPLEMLIYGRLKSFSERTPLLPIDRITKDPLVVSCLNRFKRSSDEIFDKKTVPKENIQNILSSSVLYPNCKTEQLASELFNEVIQHLKFLSEKSVIQKRKDRYVQQLQHSIENEGLTEIIVRPMKIIPTKLSKDLLNNDTTILNRSTTRDFSENDFARVKRSRILEESVSTTEIMERGKEINRHDKLKEASTDPKYEQLPYILRRVDVDWQTSVSQRCSEDNNLRMSEESKISKSDGNSIQESDLDMCRQEELTKNKALMQDVSATKMLISQSNDSQIECKDLERKIKEAQRESKDPRKKSTTEMRKNSHGILEYCQEIPLIAKDNERLNQSKRKSVEVDDEKNEMPLKKLAMDKTSKDSEDTTKHSKKEKRERKIKKGKLENEKRNKREKEKKSKNKNKLQEKLSDADEDVFLDKPVDSKVALPHLLSDNLLDSTTNASQMSNDSNFNDNFYPKNGVEQVLDFRSLLQPLNNRECVNNGEENIANSPLVNCFLDKNIDYDGAVENLANIPGLGSFDVTQLTPQTSFVWALALAVFENQGKENELNNDAHCLMTERMKKSMNKSADAEEEKCNQNEIFKVPEVDGLDKILSRKSMNKRGSYPPTHSMENKRRTEQEMTTTSETTYFKVPETGGSGSSQKSHKKSFKTSKDSSISVDQFSTSGSKVDRTETHAKKAYIQFRSEIELLFVKDLDIMCLLPTTPRALDFPSHFVHFAPLSAAVFEVYADIDTPPLDNPIKTIDCKAYLETNSIHSRSHRRKRKHLDPLTGLKHRRRTTHAVKDVDVILENLKDLDEVGFESTLIADGENVFATNECCNNSTLQSNYDTDCHESQKGVEENLMQLEGCASNPENDKPFKGKTTSIASETANRAPFVADINNKLLWVNVKSPRFMQTFRQNQIAKRKSQKEALRTATGGKVLHSKMSTTVIKPKHIGLTLEETLAALSSSSTGACDNSSQSHLPVVGIGGGEKTITTSLSTQLSCSSAPVTYFFQESSTTISLFNVSSSSFHPETSSTGTQRSPRIISSDNLNTIPFPPKDDHLNTVDHHHHSDEGHFEYSSTLPSEANHRHSQFNSFIIQSPVPQEVSYVDPSPSYSYPDSSFQSTLAPSQPAFRLPAQAPAADEMVSYHTMPKNDCYHPSAIVQQNAAFLTRGSSWGMGDRLPIAVMHPSDAMRHSRAAMMCPPDAMRHPSDAMRHPSDAMRHPQDAMICPPNAMRHPQDTMRHPSDAMRHPQDAMMCPPDAMRHPSDAMRHTQDAMMCPPDAMRHPSDAMRHPQDAMMCPPDAMRHPQDTMMCLPDAMMCPPDAMRHPQDALMCSPDAMRHPQDTMMCSPDARRHLQDTMMCPTDAIMHQQDDMMCPPDAIRHPQDALVHPQDVMRHPQDVMRHPQDALMCPPDAMRHPQDAMMCQPDAMRHPQDAMRPRFHRSAIWGNSLNRRLPRYPLLRAPPVPPKRSIRSFIPPLLPDLFRSRSKSDEGVVRGRGGGKRGRGVENSSSAVHDNFPASSQGPDKEVMRIYIFNDDKRICKNVQHYLEELEGLQMFDPYNVSMAFHFIPDVTCLVLIHETDFSHLHRIPNLLQLRRNTGVKFVGYKNVMDVKLKKLIPIFPHAGLTVIDNATLIVCEPDVLQTFCEFMVLQSKKNKPWLVIVTPQIIDLLNRLENSSDLEDVDGLMEKKRLLIHYMSLGIIQMMNNDDDSKYFSTLEYQKSCVMFQSMQCTMYRYFLFISDFPRNHPDSRLFFDAGIDIMTIKEFMKSFVGKVVHHSPKQHFIYNTRLTSELFIDANLSSAAHPCLTF